MDELIKKRIQNTISKLGTKVINTKYFPTYMNQDNFKISQRELEDYLKNEGYISISDNYMFYKPDFIKYCTENNLNTISKLKKHIFVDSGVPYITLSDLQLQDILKKDLEDNSKDKYTYSNNELVKSNIIAEHLGESFYINNRKDLIEYGLKKTYISYDLIEDFCDVFPKENRFEITYLLQDRDIELSSKKIDYHINYLDEFEKVAEEEDEGILSDNLYENKFLEYKNNNLINENINIKEKNLIINLRLNEIIATFINLGYFGDKISYSVAKEYFLPKHLMEFEKINLIKKNSKKKKRSSYIVTEECLKISNKLISLTEVKPHRDLFMDTELGKNENIDFLFKQIKNDFVEVLNKFDSFRFLFNLIKDINLIEKYSMMDILKYCIVNGYNKEFLWIFIGKGASGGKGSIYNGKDICCLNMRNDLDKNSNTNCIRCYKKYGINKSNYKKVLLNIRENRANKIYKEIENNVEELELLIDDPISLKFLVRFGTTYYNKNILRAMGLINSKAYMKSSGGYCPLLDEWRMDDNEI
ncbi:hypothetical protein [Anaerosalibacter sp. Marseille-P3206]|uniref:hypothetical protein n=1 Tax=Anaerosalibacter sp. Marseille-P3206 TaxID=1871005 RepID=UPI000984A8D8|nr:hypothetical protein [Anaerosalibacter sp. Marseille-P3206]